MTTTRATHDRERDHRGVEDTDVVTLSVAIWGYPIGTPITALLQALGALLGVIPRVMGDTVGAITGTVTRTAVYLRGPSDSVSSITEAVVAVVNP